MKLQVAGFLDNTMVNGEGLRSALFLSGCSHKCDGCHNEAMQDYNYGEEIEIDTLIDRIQCNMPLIRGVTFSGGEPFDQAYPLSILAKNIKNMGLSLWSYTGYTFEEIINSREEGKLKLLEQVDVLIDGRFEKGLMEGAKKYAGSRNQRLIDVKDSIRLKTVVMWEEKNKR
ncbi:anaerobic ribonucleoside-triphosphate reductase activating protein [Clostridium bovifaecis]|uniref:Anaerobic ribonucleoside-triphosphate reductase-activating protein n=1 Tax=Clostridium bovifaecis TaxID=2184719 RepID=A0A6I6EW50_9CLOT|nr:anaerobic ribonucleoside-triphosphate reductase activating protein [Clostridium bovifaecis]